VKCLLRVIPVAAHQRKHLWLDCYRVNPSYCPPTRAAVGGTIFTSSMQSRNLGFSRNYGQVVNVDVWSCVTHPTEAHVSEIAVHEFYHFLGFEHVAGPGNALPRYGLTRWQRASVGGWGSQFEAWMDRPWRRALARHAVWNVGWTSTMTRSAPQRVMTPPSRQLAPGGVPVVVDGGV
jgi:hypothetical protein